MKVEKKDLKKSLVELLVELTWEEFQPYVAKGVEKISKEVKVEGFRPGKASFEVLKQKVGEMSILEESARIAINKTIDEAIKDNFKEQPIGAPKVDIVKLAPENPMQYKVVLSVLPKIELGEYKKLKVKANKVEVKEDELEKTIDYLRDSRVKEVIIDREVKDTDKVIISIEMFQDKVPVEGGQSQDTHVIVGKDYLIPGFDKKLLGAKKGDTKEFSLPYPKEHFQKNLAGKMVDFKVKIKEVYKREVPKIDDKFANELGMKTVKELKEGIKKNIELEKAQSAVQKTDSEIIEKIVEKSKIGDIPDEIVNHEVENSLKEMEASIAQQGGRFEDYLSSINKSRGDMALELTPMAIKKVKGALAIREIAVKEKIEVSETDIDKKRDEILKRYSGYEKVEARVKDKSYRANLYNIIANEKVLKKLREWNIEK